MLEVKNLSFYYDKTEILKDISFSIQKGEVITILGESGSGKSTLLKLIFGLLDWTEGEIIFQKKKLLGPKGNLVPGEKNMKWVSQEFDLMPYTTVAENIGMFYSNVQPKIKEQKVSDLIKTVDLEAFSNTKVKYLSGGQKQRVALAKALAEVPDVMLLDEPFSQVDVFRKNQLIQQFFSRIKEHQISTIMVTHNIEDALSFSDKIYILDAGKIVEEGTPEVIFNSPKKKATQNLLGEINLLNTSIFGLKDKEIVIHPFQLKVSEEGIEVEVLNSFYKGSCYLIKAQWKSEVIYFQHIKKLEKGEKLKISLQQ